MTVPKGTMYVKVFFVDIRLRFTMFMKKIKSKLACLQQVDEYSRWPISAVNFDNIFIIWYIEKKKTKA